MAKSAKKALSRAATKFCKTESDLHRVIAAALHGMANYIKKTGAIEVIVKIRKSVIRDIYANG